LCDGEVDLSIEMDVAKFTLAHIEVRTVDLRRIMQQPVGRRDDSGP
jgi:hypothetical protein